MANIIIGQGKVWVGTVAGETESGGAAPVTGTVTTSDYASAYVASTGVANEYMLVPKVVLAAGQSIDVNLTFAAVASDGTKISDLVVTFTIQGQPLAVATQMVVQSSQVVDKTSVTVPVDPGSGTIPISGVTAEP